MLGQWLRLKLADLVDIVAYFRPCYCCVLQGTHKLHSIKYVFCHFFLCFEFYNGTKSILNPESMASPLRPETSSRTPTSTLVTFSHQISIKLDEKNYR